MKFAMCAALAAATALSGAALAGERVNVPVTFETNPQGQVYRAYGMIGTARNSSDGQQTIGCFVAAVGPGLQAGCEAKNAIGAVISCTSGAANMVAAAQAVGPDSYIDFIRDPAGTCTSIYVANSASNPVKQP